MVVYGAEVVELAVEAAVLLGERLAAALQHLAVHLCLLQLRPAYKFVNLFTVIHVPN